jgi:HPr kinase/phosphorylase
MQPEPETIDPWVKSRMGTAVWLHATAVAVDGRGLLILGASGTGKSSLAIELLTLGAKLISDDGVWLQTAENPPLLERPSQATSLIEARGIGLIGAGDPLESAPLALAVDLERAENNRLPPRRSIALGDRYIPLLHAARQHRLAPALILMIRHGRAEP